MGEAIGAAFFTVVAGTLGTLLGSAVRFREFGPIAAIAVMGGFIIYFNSSKK